MGRAKAFWCGAGRTITIFAFLSSFFIACFATSEGQAVPLWPNVAPGSEGKMSNEIVRVNESGDHIVSGIHRPSITPYLPEPGKATGAAVIVVPGGSHRELWIDHEGYRVAEWLSARGVAAFVLKYRLAHEDGSTYTVEGTELADIKRAIRLVKSRAAEWNIERGRVGVMGFSAGGELSALASTRFDAGSASATDVIERESSRPAFQALIYPGSARDKNFSKDTPPAFLACGEDDRAEIALGLAETYSELKRAGVSTELHIFAKTRHGFGLRAGNPPPVSDWPQLFLDWLNAEGFLKNR